MNIRETAELWEEQYLSPYASLSRNTRGRDREEAPCDIRPAYQRDRDRILHSKSFRRLKHKTQVLLAPEPSPGPCGSMKISQRPSPWAMIWAIRPSAIRESGC